MVKVEHLTAPCPRGEEAVFAEDVISRNAEAKKNFRDPRLNALSEPAFIADVLIYQRQIPQRVFITVADVFDLCGWCHDSDVLNTVIADHAISRVGGLFGDDNLAVEPLDNPNVLIRTGGEVRYFIGRLVGANKSGRDIGEVAVIKVHAEGR